MGNTLVLSLFLILLSILPGIPIDLTDAEDYPYITSQSTNETIDISDDFDQYEIHEFDDPDRKNYHCTVKDPSSNNDTFIFDTEKIKFLDDNSILSLNSSKFEYEHVRQIRKRMCQFGFNPFHVSIGSGSIHKRFKNALRLMVYNTPNMLPNLRVIRNDLDRRRKREPQIWWRFELIDKRLLDSEFDYDNYIFAMSGDFSKVQAFSKFIVCLKLYKRLNNFNDSVTRKVNLDLGIAEAILSSFGIWMMREKSVAGLMVKALNGIRTEAKIDSEDVQLEFDESLKEAADQVDPLLYSYVWLLAMAEKHEVVRIKDNRSIGVTSSGRL